MRLKQGFELRNVCGENVIIATSEDHIDFSKLISINESAAYLWQSVADQDFDAELLASYLCEEYDVSKEVALADSQLIIAEWIKCGLIE